MKKVEVNYWTQFGWKFWEIKHPSASAHQLLLNSYKPLNLQTVKAKQGRCCRPDNASRVTRYVTGSWRPPTDGCTSDLYIQTYMPALSLSYQLPTHISSDFDIIKVSDHHSALSSFLKNLKRNGSEIIRRRAPSECLWMGSYWYLWVSFAFQVFQTVRIGTYIL